MNARSPTAHGFVVPIARPEHPIFSMNSAGIVAMRRPKKSRISFDAMITAMPDVNPVTSGMRDELDDGAELEDAEQNQDHAGHERRDRQPRHAVPLDDRVDDDDERAGGTADLNAGATERRDEKSGDDRGGRAPARA